MKYRAIEALRLQYPLPPMCRMLGVSSSGYYAWRNRAPSKRQQQEGRLELEISAAHRRTHQTYGRERLQQELAANGIQVGLHRIRRLRQKLGLHCRQKRRFKVTTDSNHTLPVAPNLLEQRFTAAAPDLVWSSDITYIDTEEGWLYLAALKDLCSGEIVGYAMDERMTRHLVMQALFRAASLRRPAPGLIVHSDRGSQYCSHEYRALVTQFGMKASMSRRGNCYDNAPIESFWGTMKNELVYQRRFATRQQARREITQYIELFYNRQRRQARLGYLSPAAFMQQYRQQSGAA